ncbi:MAG: hypothetical protein HOP28_17850 [Gemmatimonadales bacterium]|nr:hypothetical protein [Gemmatimonadales bacterium]
MTRPLSFLLIVAASVSMSIPATPVYGQGGAAPPARPAPPPFDRKAPLPPLSGVTRERELLLATLAAPASVSDFATIWVTGPGGYEVARQGTTGWGCLVQRGYNGRGAFPRCDSPERVATLYPVYFLLEELRTKKGSAEDYERAVADGYRNGKYRQPPTGALSYMYAQGSIKPHVMIAQPFCAHQHLGLAHDSLVRTATTGVDVLGAGRPDCDLIIWTPDSTLRKVPAP